MNDELKKQHDEARKTLASSVVAQLHAFGFTNRDGPAKYCTDSGTVYKVYMIGGLHDEGHPAEILATNPKAGVEAFLKTWIELLRVEKAKGKSVAIWRVFPEIRLEFNHKDAFGESSYWKVYTRVAFE